MINCPLPILPSEAFDRELLWDGSSGEITSVDIASHGGYVFCGLSGGLILLFDLLSTNKSGHVIGCITAKGMHTNLLLTVKVSEDSRFVFAGVNKGSVEMLAFDISALPNWEHKVSFEKDHNSYIYTYRYMNQKLRGFDSVASVTSSTMAEYRLVCGKGIKNLHIWQFLPDHLDEGSEIKGKWTCIYDVPSNGHTLECLAFRNNGHEVLSKSSNANIRLWNISSFETDPSLKPSYQDIPDSAYTKSFHGDYAFGGLYDMVSINHKDFTQSKATKSALVEDDSECTEDKDPLASVLSFRSVYILPEAVVEWETGMKKKRVMRQIETVLATQDGADALVICSDGGVFYSIQRQSSFVEVSDLCFEPETDSVWSLRRIGAQGLLVLLRAIKQTSGGTAITICTLQSAMKEHSVSAVCLENWARIRLLHNPTYTSRLTPPVLERPSALEQPPVAKIKPPRHPSLSAARPSSVASVEPKKAFHRSTPNRLTTPNSVTMLASSPSLSPLISDTSLRYMSPHDIMSSSLTNVDRVLSFKRINRLVETTVVPVIEEATNKRERRVLVLREELGPPPKVQRVVVREVVIFPSGQSPAIKLALQAYADLKESWTKDAQMVIDDAQCPLQLQRCAELFIREALRCVDRRFNMLLKAEGVLLPIPTAFTDNFDSLASRYQNIWNDLILECEDNRHGFTVGRRLLERTKDLFAQDNTTSRMLDKNGVLNRLIAPARIFEKKATQIALEM